MPKFYGQNKKRIDPRYFLQEANEREEQEEIASADSTQLPPTPKGAIVNLDGYNTSTVTDWRNCTVTVDGAKYPIPAIFDQLDKHHEEYAGWKENIAAGLVPNMDADGFMSEQIAPAVERWCEMLDLELQEPGVSTRSRPLASDTDSTGYDTEDPNKPWQGDYGF